MKYDRNMAIIVCYKTHPGLTFAELGKQFSLSKQRVCDIVKNYERKTGRKIVRKGR